MGNRPFDEGKGSCCYIFFFNQWENFGEKGRDEKVGGGMKWNILVLILCSEGGVGLGLCVDN